MELINNTSKSTRSTSNGMNLGDLWHKCLRRWPWFIVSVALFVILAVVYLRITPKTYTRTASLMVSEEGHGGTSYDLSSSLFSNLAIFKFKNNTDSKANAKKEMLYIQSTEMLEKVVRHLSLNVEYETDGKGHRETLYGSTLPVKVQFLDLPEDKSGNLTLHLGKNITLELAGVETPVKLGDTLQTPYGRIVVTPALAFSEAAFNGMTVYVTHHSVGEAISTCRSRLKATMNEDVPSIIDFTYTDVNIERADDVLNAIFEAYSQVVADNKQLMADELSRLIDERIDLLKDELGDVDDDISTFKRDNSMADIQDIIRRARDKEAETTKKMNGINHQLHLLRYLRKFILNPANFGQVLPSNTGINNSEIEYHIRNHNNKQLDRNDWAASITEESPLVTDLDVEIANIKKALVELIDNTILAQQDQLLEVREEHNKALAELANTPNKATYLVTIERQKKVKEQIYVYLLQKREENELSQAFTAFNTLVVSAPSGSMSPTAPAILPILIAALLIGLLLPLALILLREMMNTKIRNRKDVDGSTVPFIGEIPATKAGERIVVNEGDNSPIGEAFRVVRTNMEFIAEGKGHIAMITSVDPACGKTFVAANLAAAFALKGARTVCVDLDLRQGDLAHYVGRSGQGISAYLNGTTDDWNDLILSVNGHDYLDLIPVGSIPSNPVELLSNPRLKELFDGLRARYDWVIVDCPPVETVADTAIIARQADISVFVVKAGLTERTSVSVIEGYNEEQRYPGMTLLLNGTTAL